jgi:hypothetical protein
MGARLDLPWAELSSFYHKSSQKSTTMRRYETLFSRREVRPKMAFFHGAAVCSPWVSKTYVFERFGLSALENEGAALGERRSGRKIPFAFF